MFAKLRIKINVVRTCHIIIVVHRRKAGVAYKTLIITACEALVNIVIRLADLTCSGGVGVSLLVGHSNRVAELVETISAVTACASLPLPAGKSDHGPTAIGRPEAWGERIDRVETIIVIVTYVKRIQYLFMVPTVFKKTGPTDFHIK